MHQNVQCLTNKVSLLDKIISDFYLVFVSLTEHWLVKKSLNIISKLCDMNLAASYFRSTSIMGVLPFIPDKDHHRIRQLLISMVYRLSWTASWRALNF